MLAFFKGLGVGFLCLLLFVAGVIFNVEFLSKKDNNDKLFFSRNIEVSNSLKPDILYANISFWANENLSLKSSLNSDEKASIKNTFNQILKHSKKENFCIGGDFSLEANFSYKDGMQIPKGQKLHAYLKCEFKENELLSFNEFLNDIYSIVEKSDFIGVSTPAIRAKFSKDLLDKNEEQLYKKLLKMSHLYEKNYSLDLNKSCVLKNLELNNNMPKTLKTNTKFLTTMLHEREQSLSAKALFVCK